MHLFNIIVNGLFFFARDLCHRFETVRDVLFKANKLNLVWTNAHHCLGINKLKDLRNDLAKHELDELNI